MKVFLPKGRQIKLAGRAEIEQRILQLGLGWLAPIFIFAGQ